DSCTWSRHRAVDGSPTLLSEFSHLFGQPSSRRMSDEGDSSPRAIRELARTNGRSVMGDGTEWRVYELPPGAYDRRGSSSLIFESSDAFRRIRTYPSDWRLLPDEELYLVSKQA